MQTVLSDNPIGGRSSQEDAPELVHEIAKKNDVILAKLVREVRMRILDPPQPIEKAKASP